MNYLNRNCAEATTSEIIAHFFYERRSVSRLDGGRTSWVGDCPVENIASPNLFFLFGRGRGLSGWAEAPPKPPSRASPSVGLERTLEVHLGALGFSAEIHFRA